MSPSKQKSRLSEQPSSSISRSSTVGGLKSKLTSSRPNTIGLIIFILVFAVLGAKLIFFSHASGLPPTVSITVPTNNALVCGGATTISASATDNSGSGLNNVQFKLDGTALGSAVTSSPYNYSWDNWITDAATSGSHALTATATDNDTNATTSNSINVVISEPGDVDCDGTVSGHDLSILLANYSLSYPAAEFDGGSTVTGHDLSILLTNYGKSVTLPPTNSALPTISGTDTEGDTLTATNGTWNNSPTSYTYQWQDCDSSGNNCANISTATSSSYVLQSTDVNDTIRVVVTATNAGGSQPASSGQTGVVVASGGGSTPVNSVAPYFTTSTGGASCTAGCAVQGQTISATTGTWTCSGGCGTLTYSYQWQDCTTTAGRPPTTASCSNASGAGATTATYTIGAGDVGHSLAVAVNASNNGTAGTATTTSGSSCDRASLPIPGTGSSASGTAGAALPNDPAGCSPISAVVGTTQAAEKICTNSPVTCGYPDELVPGMVGPSGTLTTVSTNCGCLPSGASASGDSFSITGNNVTVQNVIALGGFSISGTGDQINNSILGGYNYFDTSNDSFTHDEFTNGSISGNVNVTGGSGQVFNEDFFNNGCEDMSGQGETLENSYLLDNAYFSGCHYEDTYTDGGSSSSSVPATDFEHNSSICNFPDNWCMFWDDHAFSATGDYNITIDKTLIANDGFYSMGGDTINGGSNNTVTNNRISEAYQSNGGSDGPDGFGVGNDGVGVTFTNNIYDDTLGSVPN